MAIINLDSLELRHYRLIKAVIENQTVSAAARKLFLSQSAASRQLSDIEFTAGTPLFTRLNRKMVPTSMGLHLNKLANDLHVKIETAERVVNEMLSGVGGEICFGSFCLHSYGWLSEFFQQMKRSYPQFSFRHCNVNDTDINLIDAKVDFIISSLPIEDVRYTFKQLFVDELVVVLSSEHPLASKSYLLPEDISEEQIIYYFTESSQTYRYYLLRLIADFKRQFIQAPHPAAAIAMVKTQLGITFMPRWAMDTYGKGLVGVPISPDGFQMAWNVMYLATEVLSFQVILDELGQFTRSYFG